jgi:hypothetical protein
MVELLKLARQYGVELLIRPIGLSEVSVEIRNGDKKYINVYDISRITSFDNGNGSIDDCIYSKLLRKIIEIGEGM